MQKIIEEDESDDKEEIIGVKTRNWRKVNLSFAVKRRTTSTKYSERP
jgi:hypothetical protein